VVAERLLRFDQHVTSLKGTEHPSPVVSPRAIARLKALSLIDYQHHHRRQR